MMDSRLLSSLPGFCLLFFMSCILCYGLAAPANSSDRVVGHHRSHHLESEIAELRVLLQELELRVQHLETKDVWHCEERKQTLEMLRELGFLKLYKDDDDDDDDDEEDDNDKKEPEKTEESKKEFRKETEEMISYRDQRTREESGKACALMEARGQSAAAEETSHIKEVLNATCSMRPNKALPLDRRLDVRGKVTITQKGNSSVIFYVKLSGLTPPQNHSFFYYSTLTPHHNRTSNVTYKYGFHVHEFGNLTNGCESAGAHFNPLKMFHGGPNSTFRHLGDLGNVESDRHGNIDATYEFNITEALSGQHTFINKTLVIHAKEDDLGIYPHDPGSVTTGNSGERVGCCIIQQRR